MSSSNQCSSSSSIAYRKNESLGESPYSTLKSSPSIMNNNLYPSILLNTGSLLRSKQSSTTHATAVKSTTSSTEQQQQQQPAMMMTASMKQQRDISRLATMNSLNTMTLLQMGSTTNLPSQKTLPSSISSSPSSSSVLFPCATVATRYNNNINSSNESTSQVQQFGDHLKSYSPRTTNSYTNRVFHPATLQTKLSMQALRSHSGDSQFTTQDESVQLSSSYLLESGHIRERNLNSISLKRSPCNPKSIKFLRDLQEPRDASSSMNEEEDENYDSFDDNDSEVDVEEEDDDEDNNNNNYEKKNRSSRYSTHHEATKSLELPAQKRHTLLAVVKGKSAEEIALLKQEQVLPSPRTPTSQNQFQHTPTACRTTTASSKRKSSDRRISQESTTIEGRTVRVSSSETLISLNIKSLAKPSIHQRATVGSFKMISSTDGIEEEFIRRKRLSSSASAVVPDEPEKSTLNEPWCFTARGASNSNNSEAASVKTRSFSDSDEQRRSLEEEEEAGEEDFLESVEVQSKKHANPNQIHEASSNSNQERYFTPALVRCFLQAGQPDKQSQLYQHYFSKMFLNYADSLKLPSETNPQSHNNDIDLPHAKHHRTSVYLPPLKDPKKKTIFFDLDETLIHCIEIFIPPQQHEQDSIYPQAQTSDTASHLNPAASAGIRFRNIAHQSAFTKENYDPCNETLCDIKHADGQFKCLVSIRPHAIEVLKELSNDFELILLTAARKVYADAVLEKLDPEGKVFSHRFYRECCTEIRSSKQKGYVKDLRIFKNRDLAKIVLVDNSPISFTQQVENGIPIVDYCNDNKNDRELLDLAAFLKQVVLPAPDVRIPLTSKFRLHEYHSYPNIQDLQNHLIKCYSR